MRVALLGRLRHRRRGRRPSRRPSRPSARDALLEPRVADRRRAHVDAAAARRRGRGRRRSRPRDSVPLGGVSACSRGKAYASTMTAAPIRVLLADDDELFLALAEGTDRPSARADGGGGRSRTASSRCSRSRVRIEKHELAGAVLVDRLAAARRPTKRGTASAPRKRRRARSRASRASCVRSGRRARRGTTVSPGGKLPGGEQVRRERLHREREIHDLDRVAVEPRDVDERAVDEHVHALVAA